MTGKPRRPPRRALPGLLSVGLTLALIAVLVLVIELIDPAPLVDKAPPPSAAEQRALARLLDRGAAPGELSTLSLSERDLAMLVDAGLPRVLDRALPGLAHTDARVRVDLSAGRAGLTLSLPLGVAGRWVNVTATLLQTDALPLPRAVAVGGLRLPDGLAQRLLGPALETAAAIGLVQQVAFAPGQLQVRIGEAAAGDGDLDLLRAAQARLGERLAAGPRGAVDLAPLLAALLADGAAVAADPVATNRAAILALAGFALTARLPASAVPGHRLGGRTVKLRGRADLAKHWLASAALVVGTSKGFSSVVGLAKELDDAERGSGFSFADLAADRAGIRFAQLASMDAQGARRLQLLARAGFSEADLMPAIDGLPEGIGQRRLDLDYGGGYGSAYTRLVGHIDRRIDGLRLVRALAAGEGQ